MNQNAKGKMLVFTAPSGAGKTTLVHHVLSKYDYFDFSISATTRAKRDYEVHGKDYYFISIDDFKQKIQEGAFVEWEEVYQDQYYGTLKSEIDRIWAHNDAVLFDIDVQGALDIKAIFGDACLTVFIKPPSKEVLMQRLKARNTETEQSFTKRINKAIKELDYETKFDCVIVNDVLDIAKKEAEILLNKFING